MDLGRSARGVRRWLASAALLSTLLSQPLPAQAQEPVEEAKRLEGLARDAYRAQHYTEAADLFEQAARLAPYAELHYNAALAWARAEAKAPAADAFQAALRLPGLEEGRQAKAREQLSALKAELGYVRVENPTGGSVSVAHVQKAPIPCDFHLSPGTHTLDVRLPDGERRQRRIVVRPGQVASVTVPKAEHAPAPRQPDAPGPVRPDQPGGSNALWGWAAVTGGVLMGGGAVALHLQVLDTKQAYEDSGFTETAEKDRGERLQLWQNVLAGAGLVSLGVGVYLLVSDDDESTSGFATSYVTVSIHPAGIAGRLSF